MPHLVLESNRNIAEKIDFKPLLQTLHELLAEKLPTQISSCKSRVAVYDCYSLGDSSNSEGFIHLTLKILAGRSSELKTKLGEEILQKFQQTLSQAGCQEAAISIEILDLSPHYIKS